MAAPDERREVLRAQAEILVEGAREVVPEPRVDEEACRGEDERHRRGERGGHAQPDREPAHASVRSR